MSGVPDFTQQALDKAIREHGENRVQRITQPAEDAIGRMLKGVYPEATIVTQYEAARPVKIFKDVWVNVPARVNITVTFLDFPSEDAMIYLSVEEFWMSKRIMDAAEVKYIIKWHPRLGKQGRRMEEHHVQIPKPQFIPGVVIQMDDSISETILNLVCEIAHFRSSLLAARAIDINKLDGADNEEADSA